MLLGLCAAISAWAQTPAAQKSSAKASSTVSAQAQFKRGDLAAAESSVWSVLSSNPNDEQALTLLGMIRGEQHRYAEAEVLFGRVVQLNPKSVVARTHLANALADRKSTRLNSSHSQISYAVFCLKKKRDTD